MTEAEAERITVRISHKLGTLADAYESVMPLIREAIERRAYVALGYPSVSAYAADRFDDSLGRLGVDRRRDVVKEFSAAGMSIRAIAPILGVGKDTVQRDQQAAGVSHETPDPPAKPGEVEADSSQEGFEESRLAEVTGLDGKVYTRPAPASNPPKKPRRWPLPDQFRRATWQDLRRAVEKIERLAEDDRVARNRHQYADLARGVTEYRDRLDRAIEKMTDDRRDH